MKFLPAALVGASLVTVSLLAAAPAVAAGNAVDPGDSMYAVNCDSIYNDYQLFSVDSTTAFSTAIGVGTGSDEDGTCAGQPAYNPATGVSYYVQWNGEYEGLASIDLATGVSTAIGEFYYDNGEFPEYISADAIAIGADGTAYLLGEGRLWSINLATAWVEPIGESLTAYGFAADPVTGKFYAVTQSNEIYELDVTTGASTLVDQITFPADPENNFRTYSLQFDGAGTFWVEVDHHDPVTDAYATLWSFTLATVDAPVFSGYFSDDPYYTEALLIVPGTPEVVLAETGSDSSALPLVAGAAGLALVAGLTMVARRRRTA